MGDSLFVLAVTGVLVSVLRLLVFGYLWRRESAEHLKLWTLGFMVQIAAQMSATPGMLGQPVPVLQALTLCFAFGTALLLTLGTYRLIGRPPAWRRWALLGGLGVVGVFVMLAAGANPVTALIVPVTLLSLAYLSMGLALYRYRHEMSGLGVGLTIFSLAAIGLHFADFPFLSQVPWFVPWGIGLQLFLDVVLTVGLVVLSFDRTHAARAQADARYVELADTIGVGTYTAATGSRFTTVNGALVRMLGYGSAAEVLQLDLQADLLFTPGEPSTHVLDCEAPSRADTTWKRKDGRPLVVQLHGRAARDAAGKLIAFRGFVVDRTEAQGIMEALNRAQKLEAVGRLAGGVAHDFNNLLTIILSSLELLARAPGDPTPLRDAMEATDQAAQLTRRLLAFGRKQVSHVAPVDVGAAALRTVEMLGRSLGARHRVETSGVTPGLWTNMDAGQLEQVVVNLVLNAKDAMAEGGVIEVSTRSVARGQLGGVELVVKDPGHGISPEDRLRIFEPFFSTREAGRGTGLGLSTVHGIVTQAGGHIDVESAVGRGSRFALWFPQTVAPGGAPAQPVSLAAPPAGKRVLVVDDEVAIRRTVCRMLEAAGHSAREVGSGNQAVALIAGGERFDVLLSDVRMPDGDGPFAAQRVRELAPWTRVILMSGFQDEVDEVTRSHADAFLAKPFTRGDLLAAIEAPSVLRAAG